MTQILIPRARNNQAMVAWLIEHVGPSTSTNQSYVRQTGHGWDLTTHMKIGGEQLFWQVSIHDPVLATAFALRWV